MGLRAAEMSYRGLSGILEGATDTVPLQSQTSIRVKVGSTETADRKAALNGMGSLCPCKLVHVNQESRHR